MLLVVPPYKKLHGFLYPKSMSFFIAWQTDNYVKNCLPSAEDSEINTEGNEVNTAAAQLCFLRQGWHQ